jgi:hypothetical protein
VTRSWERSQSSFSITHGTERLTLAAMVLRLGQQQPSRPAWTARKVKTATAPGSGSWSKMSAVTIPYRSVKAAILLVSRADKSWVSGQKNIDR